MGVTNILEAGKLLTVAADANSTGSLVRLSNLPGGGANLGSNTLAASTSITVGPYSVATRWDVISDSGLLTYTIGVPATEADLGGAGSLNGSPSGTGVVASEYGDGTIHRTVLTLTNASVTMTDATTAGNQGSLKVYDFPAGAIQILGAKMDLTTLAGAGGITDTAALVGSLGSVAAANDNATLTSTEADIIPSTAGTLSGGAGTLKKHGSLVATAFDGTTTPLDAILNLAVPDAGSTANDTVTVNGTITFTWTNTGDY